MPVQGSQLYGVVVTKASVRPIIALIAFCVLSALAVMKSLGGCPELPPWFLDAYLFGCMVDVLGWQVVRELEKRKAAP